jgi:hypothetical protein
MMARLSWTYCQPHGTLVKVGVAHLQSINLDGPFFKAHGFLKPDMLMGLRYQAHFEPILEFHEPNLEPQDWWC